MTKIGESFAEGESADIYQDEHGYFTIYSNVSDAVEKRSPYCHSLDEIYKRLTAAGVHVILYNGRDPGEARKEYWKETGDQIVAARMEQAMSGQGFQALRKIYEARAAEQNV